MDADINIKLLVNELKKGNERTFTALYDFFSKALYLNILRLVKDEEIAKELLQDLFLAIWEKRHTLDAEKSFKSFLYKIAENLVYTHYRKVAKDQRLIASLIATASAYEANAEEAIISKESNGLLKAAIESLSPQRKLVYTLCKLDGKSYQEVSEELGISCSTISDHIVKANKVVKEHLLINGDLALVFFLASTYGVFGNLPN